MTMKLEELVSEDTGVKIEFVNNIIELFDENATIPFVSRYRKDKTGGLDEIAVASVYDSIEKFRTLADRKVFIKSEIDKKGKLTEELILAIDECKDPKKLEDIYLPYKDKKKTKAEKAKEAGLGDLAVILMGSEDKGNPEELAVNYINVEAKFDTVEKVLEGALDIITQDVVEKSDLIEYFLRTAINSGFLTSEVKKGFDGSDRRFEEYYGYSEKISSLIQPRCSHRYLAMRRGEECGALTLKSEVSEEEHIFTLKNKYMTGQHFYKDIVEQAVNRAYNQYLRPALETRIKQELFEVAQNEAISVFSKNMESILMAPPIPPRNVIGMDPGIRTGIKTAILDKDGRYLANTVLKINTPFEKDRALLELKVLIKKYKTGAIGVGTGTGSKETLSFAKQAVKELGEDVIVALVDETGASVYSASEVAREEFPDLDLTVRGAISIGRRLQNPLAELVKVDPRSAGAGQYQHDLDQKKLKAALERVIQICVNNIGVDINTASYSILAKISGLAEKTAKNIVKFREENGFFKDRGEIKKVKGIGPKSFEQCAGFLRIRDGKNPLDSTRVHPESYSLVVKIADDLKVKIEDLIGNKDILSKIDTKKYIDDKTGKHTVESVIEDLKYPALDPRKEFRNVNFLEGIDKIEDLKPNMVTEGVVKNITNFGAFIDVGVHQDGLCHISKMKGKSLRTGDIVTVKIISADPFKKRISLDIC
ncbi:helix-hairpin-helix domain-containing protein [bacterium]|nr:helix-hairpin-helix domain-containing protein [bacterium]